MTIRFIFIALAIAVVATGCSTRGSFQDSPIGIGSSPNDLKRSPCTCIILPNGGAPLQKSLAA